MAETALIAPSQPLAPQARGLKPALGQDTDRDADRDGSDFAQLLSAIETVASTADQVVSGTEVTAQAAFVTNTPPVAPGLRATGLATNGLLNEGRRLTPFSEIRPLVQTEPQPQKRVGDVRVPSDLAQNNAPQGAERAFLTSQQQPLSPAQAAALANIEGVETNSRALQQDIASLKPDSQIASTPRIEAALAQQAAPETSNPVVRQVATNLSFVARGEMERLRFDLHPEELGRVQIQLQRTGTVTRVTVVTETAQAFEALKQGAQSLQQSLADAGFDTDDLRFQSGEDRGDGRQRQADERQDRDERARRSADLNETEERTQVVIRPADQRDRVVFL
ncbi:MAG: flagellar hook-length control protein FliK [Pseudomonadota bacterium]